jgi:CheY-like chemotaxis protein
LPWDEPFEPSIQAAVVPTILCIDDRADGLNIRKLMLETQGYAVLTARNGESGLGLLAAHPADAVILDYRMEGMDGLAVATAIRARYGQLPIVLLSGYPKDIPQELLDLVDATVTKGEDPQVLLDELRRLTGGAKKPPTKEIAARVKDYLNRKSDSE